MARVIRDLPDTSSYWAAVWAICPMQDVHVICDAPIGCFNLVATAVPDYTDAIPHIENITPSVITETEVGGSGTGPAVQRTYEGLRDEGMLEGKQLIVISTAESEMIGSDLSDLVKRLAPGTTFYHSDSLAEDEWDGRDRVLHWLWQNYGEGKATSSSPAKSNLVNIVGPTYGCFNAYADLHELKRLIKGAGGEVNLVYPLEANLADTPRLADAAVNVVPYQEFGHTLADALGKKWLHAPIGMKATTKFVLDLGKLLGTEEQAKAFIRQEKATTLQAVWDLWKGPQGDWFGTTNIGIVASKTYVDGLSAYLADELGMSVTLAAPRPQRKGDLGNEEVRQAIHKGAPAFLFGSINEKIYLAEAGAKYTTYIPAAFPGPVVRRSVGTPFMGYRGCVYVIQEVVNALYETLFNFLPVDSAYAKQKNRNGAAIAAPSTQQAGNLPWQTEAKLMLDEALEAIPFVPRISASRELQMKVEAVAMEREMAEVSAELVQEILAAQSG